MSLSCLALCLPAKSLLLALLLPTGSFHSLLTLLLSLLSNSGQTLLFLPLLLLLGSTSSTACLLGGVRGGSLGLLRLLASDLKRVG